jgi:prepilin-type processing-associated H-X9-DG protein
MSTESQAVKKHRLVIACCAAALALIFIVIFIPALQPTRDGFSGRSLCTNKLKQIGMALQNYHDVYDCYPPAFVADADGKPMHSWRALLLPFFEEEGLKGLYDFNQPWNGPNNRRVAERQMEVYRCHLSNAPNGETSYVAIVGPETGWPGAEARNARQFTDGTSNTIAIVEVADSGINWLEPRDLTIGRAMRGINPPEIRPAISSRHSDGVNVLSFDGSVHFLRNDISNELLHELLTANGGEVVDWPPTD